MAFEWSSDVEEAAWWAGELHSFARDVGAVVPDTFPAYARVFHPIEDGREHRTWAGVAAENERIVHAEMQLHEISGPLGAPRPKGYDMDGRVSWGSLPRRELEVLARMLASHTTTPNQCWWCAWEGYAQLRDSPTVARVSVPQRSYVLLRGPVADAGDLYELLSRQSPNVWWPDDRAWFVATEIDFAWTYVGGSAGTIGAVLGDPRLEALPAKSSDQFSYDSDVLNAALDSR